MEALETLGLSIQRFRFSETSQIVHFLTKDWGRIVCLVKGAYRPKNNFKGNIDLMELSRITFIRQKGSAIYLLRARKLMGNYPTLHQKIDAFAQSCLVTELLRHGVQEHQKIPGLFELVLVLLDSLESGKLPHQQVSFFFQGMFLRLLGYALNLDYEAQRQEPVEEQRFYEYRVEQGPVSVSRSEGPMIFGGSQLLGIAASRFDDPAVLRDAGRLLREVIRHHLDGRELKSRKVLLDLHRARMPAKPSPEAG